MSELSQHPVLFYNVENLFDTFDDPHVYGDEEFTPEGEKLWDTERFREKLENLSQALTFFGTKIPMAIGLAEIENRYVLEALINTSVLKNYQLKIVHFDSEDRRGIDCGFLYNPELLTVELETKIVIQLDDEPFFRTRDILHVQAKLNNGHHVHFFVNHWPSRREGIEESESRRTGTAKILRREIDEILHSDPHANIIVMGDFNDTPVNHSIHKILRAKGQHEQIPGDLINLLIEEHNRGEGTHVRDEKWEVFDQFIVSQGLLQGKSGLEVVKNNAFILRDERLMHTFDNGDKIPNSSYSGDFYHGGYSDHLPIYLYLTNKN